VGAYLIESHCYGEKEMQSEERLGTEAEEAQVSAKIEELDTIIVRLQKRKQELTEAMETMKGEMTFGRTPSPSGFEKGEDQDSVDEGVLKSLNSVRWKGFGQGKEGEWTFVTDRQGNLTKELQPARGFIEGLKAGAPIAAGKYRYKVSQDGKFLNRYELKKGQSYSNR
jgi:hypothetical protein